MTGKWPVGKVIPIDGDPMNIKYDNLKEVFSHNKLLNNIDNTKSNNISGYKNVYKRRDK
jgi:hypothetical protein